VNGPVQIVVPHAESTKLNQDSSLSVTPELMDLDDFRQPNMPKMTEIFNQHPVYLIFLWITLHHYGQLAFMNHRLQMLNLLKSLLVLTW